MNLKMFKPLVGSFNFTCAQRLINTSPRYFNIFNIASFKEFETKILQSTKPIIVGFFKEGCNPCMAMKPRIESVIQESNGKISLAKIEITQNRDIAQKYEVEAVPVLLAMKKGKVLDRMNGLQDRQKVKSFVENALAQK